MQRSSPHIHGPASWLQAYLLHILTSAGTTPQLFTLAAACLLRIVTRLKRGLGTALEPGMQAPSKPSFQASAAGQGCEPGAPAQSAGPQAAAAAAAGAGALPRSLPQLPEDPQEAAAFLQRCALDTVNVSQIVYLIGLHVSLSWRGMHTTRMHLCGGVSVIAKQCGCACMPTPSMPPTM